jgi:hypothetical protein
MFYLGAMDYHRYDWNIDCYVVIRRAMRAVFSRSLTMTGIRETF